MNKTSGTLNDAADKLVRGIKRKTLPDPAIATERDLFVQLEGLAHLCMDEAEIVFGVGGAAAFTRALCVSAPGPRGEGRGPRACHPAA